jgi:signal peptidase I
MGLAMPGLGQIHNGELIKGISYFVILLVVCILGMRWTVLLPDRSLILGLILTNVAALAIYLGAMIDAYRNSAKEAKLQAYNRWYFYAAVWLLGWILAAGAVFGHVRDNIAEAYKIASGSMEPTVMKGDRVLADKTAYRRMPPKKGDVVVLVYPDDRSKKYIKRIEALPGDTIIGADGTTKVVPHGYVYLLGDNRNNSYDSRQFGFISLTDVIAKVRQIYFSSGQDGIRWNRIGLVVSR